MLVVQTFLQLMDYEGEALPDGSEEIRDSMAMGVVVFVSLYLFGIAL